MPTVNNNLQVKAGQVFGATRKVDDLGTAVAKAQTSFDNKSVLTLAGLNDVWGLSPEQLKGLESFGVLVGDGIDEAELENLIKLKEETLALFQGLLVGCGLSEDELAELYEKLWALAAKGELTKSSWNDLMSENGLADLEMNGSSFQALLGGQDNFGGDNVGGVAEFVVALRNLDLTMQSKGANGASRLGELKVLCEATNFNIIYMDKAGVMLKDVLGRLAPDYDFNGKTDEQIFADIKAGKFGEALKKKAEGGFDASTMSMVSMNDLMELTFALLRDLEQAAQKNLDGDTNLERIGQYNSRKNLLAELINEGPEADQKSRNALLDELVAVYSGKKTEIDMKVVEDAKTPKAVDNEIDYEKKSGGLEYMRRTVKAAEEKRLKETPEPIKPTLEVEASEEGSK